MHYISVFITTRTKHNRASGTDDIVLKYCFFKKTGFLVYPQPINCKKTPLILFSASSLRFEPDGKQSPCSNKVAATA